MCVVVTQKCPRTVAHQAPLAMGSSGKNTGEGCHFLLQGIFRTQGLNLGVPHCRRILYRLSQPLAARSHSHLMGTLGGAIQGFLQGWPGGRPADTGRACSPWGCLLERRGDCWKGKGHTGPLWGWGGLDGSGLFSFRFESTVSLFSLSGHPLTKGRGGKKTGLKSIGNIFRKVESTK